MRIGRILQTQTNSPDAHAALGFYNHAISSGKFLNKEDESTAYYYRGSVYRSLPNEFTPDQALADFVHALEINSNSYSAWLSKGLVYLYDFNDVTQAEANFRRAILLDPKIPNAYFYLGDVFRARGDLEQAKAFYLQAQALNPNWQAPKQRLKTLEGSQ